MKSKNILLATLLCGAITIKSSEGMAMQNQQLQEAYSILEQCDYRERLAIFCYHDPSCRYLGLMTEEEHNQEMFKIRQIREFCYFIIRQNQSHL